MSDQSKITDLTALLREFYTDAEAFVWLTTPQPQFDGAVALNMIAAGRANDLILSLRRMADGVYL